MNVKNLYTVAVVLCLSVSLTAQNVNRAYGILQKGECEKAKEMFLKILEMDSMQVAANLGMALALSDDKSACFDIVGTLKYVVVAKKHLDKFTPGELEAIGEYLFAKETRKSSRAVDKKIVMAVGEIENQLIRYIREERDLAAVHRILNEYKGYKHYANVMHIRNQFEFYSCMQQQSVEAFTAFIDKYPGAAQVKKAIKMRDLLVFEKVKMENNEAAVCRYIAAYPRSVYVQQAIKLRDVAAYAGAQETNTLESYYNFTKKYPEAQQVLDAKKHLYTLLLDAVSRTNDLAAHTMFVALYPENERFPEVFDRKASLLGNQSFGQTGLDNKGVNWLKSFDNKGQIDSAWALACTNDGGYVIAGTTQRTDTAATDVWVVRLDGGGKLVWQRIIEQPLQQRVSNVFVSASNDVVVVGYTQASAHSPVFKSWYCKMDSKGATIHNKILGDYAIAACCMMPKDKILLSVIEKDNVPPAYSLQLLDANGNAGWSRKFVGRGVFSSITRTARGQTVLVGTTWVASVDSSFYITWEDSLRNRADVTYASSGSEVINVIGEGGAGVFLYGYSTDGVMKEQAQLSADGSEKITGFVRLADDNYLLVSRINNQTHLKRYDAKALKIAEKTVGGSGKVIAVKKNSKGETIYLLQGSDFGLFNLSDYGF